MTYNAEMGYNVVEESLGALKKINSSGEVEHLGNVWHTDRPYNIMQTRMLSINDALHLCAGYGNGDEVLRYNSLASGADNGVHIVYGKTLHYVLPTFQPNGRSIYAALAGLAKSVNATLSFEKNVIMITDRRPFRALTDGATGTGTADIRVSVMRTKHSRRVATCSSEKRFCRYSRYLQRCVDGDHARGVGQRY